MFSFLSPQKNGCSHYTLHPFLFQALFYGNNSLIKSPALPATGLAEYCYGAMFNSSHYLKDAPALPATTLAKDCYQTMFIYSHDLTGAPELPAMDLAPQCYYGMFMSCSSLVTPPTLPATGLAYDCYRDMFNKTPITSAPELPANRVVEDGGATHIYSHMFEGCSNLSSINVALTNWETMDNLPYYTQMIKDWVSGVAENGVFYKPAALDEEFGPSRIPSGWQVVNKDVYYAPLTFKGLSSSNAVQLNQHGSPSAIVLDYSKNNGPWTTYNVGDIIELNENETVAFSGTNDHFSKDQNNFYHFTMSGIIEASSNIQSLINFSDSCTRSCYFGLFWGCDSLITAPQLLATTLAYRCYYQMFRGCTSLTSAPDLPATRLNYNSCYQGMFYGCTSLSSINVSFTDWHDVAVNQTTNWLYNVASQGTFIKPTALEVVNAASNIPYDWTVVNKD